MTVEQQHSNLPANQGPNNVPEGLEDLDASDIQIPRITILHKEALFKDNLSGETFKEFNAVFLGLVKQRVMWDKTVNDGDKPMCKSNDHSHGYPNVDDNTPKTKQFPWGQSNFDPSQYAGKQPVLPCEACVFKEWGQERTAPPCSELFTFPIQYDSSGDGAYSLGLITIQRTSIKPAKALMTSFLQRKQPMFTGMVRVSLQIQSRGGNQYCVLVFTRNGPTNQASWDEYAQTFRGVRAGITQPPVSYSNSDQGVNEPSSNVNTAPAPQAAPVSQPVPQPAPPTVQAPPQPQQPTVTPPVVQPVTVPQPAPAVVTPQPATTVPAPGGRPSVENDDLPF